MGFWPSGNPFFEAGRDMREDPDRQERFLERIRPCLRTIRRIAALYARDGSEKEDLVEEGNGAITSLADPKWIESAEGVTLEQTLG